MWAAVVGTCAYQKEYLGTRGAYVAACDWRFARCVGLKSWIDYTAANHRRLITVCDDCIDVDGRRGNVCNTDQYNYMTNTDDGHRAYQNLDEFA